MFFLVAYGDADEGDLIRWSLNSVMYDSDVLGDLAEDGEDVGRWSSDSALFSFSQSNAGKRPTYNASQVPSRHSANFENDDHLAGVVTLPVRLALIIVASLVGSRTVFSIDTSGSTTKPAVAVVIEEMFE